MRWFRDWEALFRAKTWLELGVKQGRKREAVPPRLPSGWAAGLDLDRLRGVFREPEGTTASGWNDAEVSLSEFCILSPFPSCCITLFSVVLRCSYFYLTTLRSSAS